MSTPQGEPRPDPSTPPGSAAADDAARGVARRTDRSEGADRPLGADGSCATAPSAPGPVADDAARRPAADTPDGKHHINPARLEVRVRRLALLGLVLVPVVYFIAQSLR
ncbi:hypothetical protein CWC38_08010 [Kocuria tytonicola]|uniref:Uncharacterized protein n=1 Tax=Kocuria tytonicola TaxID=2055946 RepID=A0A3L9L0D9_9MICC|nr:hypothetical protein [Kocuria tytonicola]RLY91564.1 hypothetical protein EAE32_09970 [Kocuria tytonicola]RLZ03023.1 hypothetical protein CWC38_08010 [Kocuria tytonicola]